MLRFLISFLICSSVAFAADNMAIVDWDLADEAVIENDGNEGGNRICVPIQAIEGGKTFDFEIISGDFKSLTIYAKGRRLEDNEEAWTLVSARYDSLKTFTPDDMRSLRSWKDGDEWYKYEQFIFTVNGDMDRLESMPVKVKMTFRELSHEEKHTATNIGYAVLLVGFMLLIRFLYKTSTDKIYSLLIDRKNSNGKIKSVIVVWGFVAFFVILLYVYGGSFIVGSLTNAPQGFNNELGMLMVIAVFAAIYCCYRKISDVKYNRCPKCRKYRDIIDLGTEYAGGESTTYYRGNSTVGKKTSRFYHDYRQCPECENVWSVLRVSVSGWGETN